MSAGLLLIKSVLTPLAKSVLIPLELAVAASATYAAKVKDMKKVKSLEEFDLSKKKASEKKFLK